MVGGQPTRENPNTAKDMEGITVVIPTLNEAKAIGMVIDEIIQAGIPPDNILVVDGGSIDGTREIAESKGVKVVIQDGKGKSDAIKSSIKYINTEIAVFMDGDYTYPANHIKELVKMVKNGYNLAIGWRHPEPGAQGKLYSLGNRILTRIFNLIFSTNLHDVLSGMYAIRREILQELNYESKGFGIESEIAAHVASTGGRIGEVPIKYRKRIGEKKLSVKHGLNILVDIIRLAWRYNPVFLVFSIGALLLVPGLMLGAWVGYKLVAAGELHYIRGLIAVILISTGVVSLLLAILALYMKRMEVRLLRLLRRINYSR